MFEVNRSVLIIKPKQAFADWLQALPIEWETHAPKLQQLREDCNAFLIPITEERVGKQDYIRQYWKILFEGELADWCVESAYWPQQRSETLFLQWFDVELHSVLADLDPAPLERLEYSDDALNLQF